MWKYVRYEVTSMVEYVCIGYRDILLQVLETGHLYFMCTITCTYIIRRRKTSSAIGVASHWSGKR